MSRVGLETLAARFPRAWRAARRALLALSLAMAALSFAAAMTPLPEELREPAGDAPSRRSLRVLDRNGRLLREVRADDHTRAMPLREGDLGATAVLALVAAEDRRFYGHAGVDPASVMRAAAMSVWRGRIVSGASTLTMQLARLVRPHRRNVVGKAGEVLLALKLDAWLSKDRIVTEYANRAPFGPDVRGLGAAARHHFDKEPRALTAGEAAMLAALPRGPAYYDPARHMPRLAARRLVVLERMRAFGLVSESEHTLAAAEPTRPLGRGVAPAAIHFVSAVLRGSLDDGRVPPGSIGTTGTVLTTLDASLQLEVEQAVRANLRHVAAKGVTAAAALVIDNERGEILAYVGSPDAFNERALGGNDGVRARRQAGSTLKPFLYGLALDRGEIDAASLLADVPLTVPIGAGAFVPHNYDGKFRGPVRARVALASSLNVPAVSLITRVGVGAFLTELRSAGFSLPESPEHYGEALALGDGDVTLLELARAYAALARGGRTLRLHGLASERAPTNSAPPAAEADDGARVLSPASAWLVSDMLADREARMPAFGERNVLELPFRAAVKTGTSKGFRDNWAVGFTARVTAAVWAGNFDGTSMHDVSGIAGAGPILRDTLTAAHARLPSNDADVAAPDGLIQAHVCALSGKAKTPECPHAVREWLPKDHERTSCTMHTTALVETKTGRLATSACDARSVERRVFEDYPAEFLDWARGAKRPLMPEHAAPCGALRDHATSREAAVRIEHPARDAHYYLAPDRPSTIAVRVVAEPRAQVVLLVDGREVAAAKAGEPLPWVPSPGRHTLIAEARGGRSEPVEVVVD